MGSSIRPRLTVDIAGQPIQFAQPFVQAYLELEQDPLTATVPVPADDSAVVWSGAPPFSTLDFIALMSDRDVTLAFAVNGGGADDFELFLRGGGFPLTLHGLPSTDEITSITATNADTTNTAFVSMIVAQEAS